MYGESQAIDCDPIEAKQLFSPWFLWLRYTLSVSNKANMILLFPLILHILDKQITATQSLVRLSSHNQTRLRSKRPPSTHNLNLPSPPLKIPNTPYSTKPNTQPTQPECHSSQNTQSASPKPHYLVHKSHTPHVQSATQTTSTSIPSRPFYLLHSTLPLRAE